MAALLAALVASPAVVAVIALVALGAFCCLCCAGAPQEERAPRPAPAPAVEAPAPTPQPPGTLRVVARCEVTGFGPDGEPKVVGHVQPGDLVRPVAEDDKSVRVEQADGTPAWVPRRCVESH